MPTISIEETEQASKSDNNLPNCIWNESDTITKKFGFSPNRSMDCHENIPKWDIRTYTESHRPTYYVVQKQINNVLMPIAFHITEVEWKLWTWPLCVQINLTASILEHDFLLVWTMMKIPFRTNQIQHVQSITFVLLLPQLIKYIYSWGLAKQKKGKNSSNRKNGYISQLKQMKTRTW